MNNDDQRFCEALVKLRKLLAEEDLYLGETEIMHSTILHFANLDAEQAFKHIKQTYRLKLQNEKWFVQLPLTKYEKLLKRNISAVLNERDSRGRKVYLVKLCRIDVNRHQAYEYSCIDDIWLVPCYREPETIKNGLVLIIDFHNAPWSLLKYCTPHNAKINSDKVQMIPIRNVEFHIIGLNVIVNTMFSLIRPFLTDQTQKNIHMHKNLDSLYRYVDKEALPPEYGGLGKFEPELYDKYVKDNEAILTEIASIGYKRQNTK